MRLLVCLVLALIFVTAPAVLAAPRPPMCPEGEADFPLFYTDRTLFDAAEKQAESVAPIKVRPSGLTVPHHMLAAHIIARGFKLADGHRYRRIIVLFPDHFKVSEAMFATTRRGFATLNGVVPVDHDAVETLLKEDGLAEENCLFSSDHGLQAMLPFIARHFPATPIVPIAVSIKSERADWEHMADLLAGLAGPDTLVLQSTDFSHYLPHHEARLADQQTLNILAARDFTALAGLVQPDHVDSLGALYIQMKVQDAVFGAAPLVFANENSQQYSDRFTNETTSYVGMVFSKALAGAPSPGLPDAETVYLAGDTFFGRAMTGVMADPEAADAVAGAINALTAGRKLAVNLEGVILPNVPDGLPELTLAMPESLATGFLKRINAAGIGLANNHANDLGPNGLAETRSALQAAGLAHAGQGEKLALGGMDIVMLSDLDTHAARQTDILTPGMLDALLLPDAARPVIAFVHWGREYVTEPGEREHWLADQMRMRGVSAVIGAHPHVASQDLSVLAGGQTLISHTIGNFLFDQSADKASGALAEVTVFKQGTIAVRLLPIPNLFDLGKLAARR